MRTHLHAKAPNLPKTLNTLSDRSIPCLPFPPGGLLFCLFTAGLLLSEWILCSYWDPISYSLEATVLYCSLFIFFSGIVWSFPTWLPIHVQWVVLVVVIILARLSVAWFPISDDVNRYVWEGYISHKGLNPYIYPPSSPVLDVYKSEIHTIWQGINHKDNTACYPPLTTMLFGVAAGVSPTLLFFKLMISFFDLGVIVVLSLMAHSRKLPPARVALYALNPLVLVFISGESHLDVIQVFFVVLCFHLFSRARDARGFLSLGCAVMSKYFALLLFPLVISSKNWRSSVVLPITLLALYLPFLDTGEQVFRSLAEFTVNFTYNDSIAEVLRLFAGRWAFHAVLVLLAISLSVIFLLVHDPLRSAYLAVGALLCILPIFNPWYLVLITPFLVFFPSRAWLYLHLAIIPSLYLEYHAVSFLGRHWGRILEYGPFFFLLAFDFLKRKSTLTFRSAKPVCHMSVVVPALNEANQLSACLESIGGEADVLEVIVVDGGSTDGTPELARSFGATVIETARGRGHQIKTGVEQARGDVILVLHADCRLRPGVATLVLKELNRLPHSPGGAVGMRYSEEPSITGRVVAWLNNTRARYAGMAFGDQAQFARRDALPLLGGFPDLMLMEDVEFSMRLKELGSTCFLPDGVRVSPRRWERVGFWHVAGRVIGYNLVFLIQRRLKLGDENRRALYERYYSSKQA